GTIRFSLPHPFDSTVHAKSAPTSRLPTIASIAANRWWENHIAGACPPKYNRFSRRREFRSGFFADLRADVRVPVLVWEEEVQSQPIVRLSAHVSFSYFHVTLADHVFEIAWNLTRLWVGLTLVFVVSFAILGYYGGEIYQTMPPVPKRVITSDGEVLFTEKEIKDGQNVWQSIGGQEVGTIWGHRAYVAPDWNADWLHREAMW